MSTVAGWVEGSVVVLILLVPFRALSRPRKASENKVFFELIGPVYGDSKINYILNKTGMLNKKYLHDWQLIVTAEVDFLFWVAGHRTLAVLPACYSMHRMDGRRQAAPRPTGPRRWVPAAEQQPGSSVNVQSTEPKLVVNPLVKVSCSLFKYKFSFSEYWKKKTGLKTGSAWAYNR